MASPKNRTMLHQLKVSPIISPDGRGIKKIKIPSVSLAELYSRISNLESIERVTLRTSNLLENSVNLQEIFSYSKKKSPESAIGDEKEVKWHLLRGSNLHSSYLLNLFAVSQALSRYF